MHDADGEGVREIHTYLHYLWGPAFVPDGSETRIHVKPLEGGMPRLLIDRQATLPKWSPDGSRIAYTLDRDFDRGIFLVEADGSNASLLSRPGGFPVWWPDASKIGYLIRGGDGNQTIQVKSLVTGTVETLDVRFRGLNFPFDVDGKGRLVTTQSLPFSHEVWLLK